MIMLVIWLIENGKKLFGKTLAVILLACLLGAVVYYSPIGNVSPKPAFAFVFAEGNQTQMESGYVNTSLLWRFFEMQFGLENGSRIYVGGVGLHLPKGQSWGGVQPEYHGGFNASVQDILVTLWSYRRAPWGTINVTGPTHIGTIANVSDTQNVTIHASLVTSTVIDMGTCTFVYGPEASDTSSSGYWNIDPLGRKIVTNCPKWNISSTELLGLLEESGTVTIAFDATFHIHVNYNITLGEETEIGEKDLYWEGTLGTIEIRYDENSIFEVRYDFIRVELTLLTLQQETNP